MLVLLESEDRVKLAHQTGFKSTLTKFGVVVPNPESTINKFSVVALNTIFNLQTHMNHHHGRDSDPNRWAIIKLEESNSVYNPTCGISIMDSETTRHSRTQDLQSVFSPIGKRLRVASWVWIPFLYIMGILLAIIFWKSEHSSRTRNGKDQEECPTPRADRGHTDTRRDVPTEQNRESNSEQRRDLSQETFTWYNNDIYRYDSDTDWPDQESKADKYCV